MRLDPYPEEKPRGRGLLLLGALGGDKAIPGHPEAHLLPVSAPKLYAAAQVCPTGCGARRTWGSLSSKMASPLCCESCCQPFHRLPQWLGSGASRGVRKKF